MHGVLVSLLAAITAAVRSRASMQLEILALRHRLAVYQRSPSDRTSDRPTVSSGRGVWSGGGTSWSSSSPTRSSAWQRRRFRDYWRKLSISGKPGRPTVLRELRDLIRVRVNRPPSPTWRAFLANHVKDLVAVDFFVVPTVRFTPLFVFVVLAHHRRRIVHFNVTEHPTAAWTAQQIVEVGLPGFCGQP